MVEATARQAKIWKIDRIEQESEFISSTEHQFVLNVAVIVEVGILAPKLIGDIRREILADSPANKEARAIAIKNFI